MAADFAEQIDQVLDALEHPERANVLTTFLTNYDPSRLETAELFNQPDESEVLKSAALLDRLVECLDAELKWPHMLFVLGLLRCLSLVGTMLE